MEPRFSLLSSLVSIALLQALPNFTPLFTHSRFSHQNPRSSHLVAIRSTHRAHRTFCFALAQILMVQSLLRSPHILPLRLQYVTQYPVLSRTPSACVLLVSATDSSTHTIIVLCVLLFISAYIKLTIKGSGPNGSSHCVGLLWY